jgi:hypothetical protein
MVAGRGKSISVMTCASIHRSLCAELLLLDGVAVAGGVDDAQVSGKPAGRREAGMSEQSHVRANQTKTMVGAL